MEWTPGGVSSDVEDRRDESGGGGPGFGGFGPHLGVGGTVVVLLLSLVFHQNFFALLSNGGGSTVSNGSSAPPARSAAADANDKGVQFVSAVLDNVQNTWTILLPQQAHTSYRHAKLVLFRDQYQSACGEADSATGPFYCPGDEKVYLDLGFFDELSSRFGAPGDFAKAYVIAHEVGHHVQKILGIEAKVQQSGQRTGANSMSVKLELQADCFAGIWAHSTEQGQGSIRIDQNDVHDALGAAAAVGDDRLQRMATGKVNPESFTHGTSAQRDHWFQTGLDSGQISACDTFNN
jgi:predicted metalloprotease